MFEEYHGRARETGIDVSGITLTGGSQTSVDLIAQAVRNFQHIYADDKIRVVRSVAEIEEARRAGKESVFFNCQGADCLDNKPHFYVPLLRGLVSERSRLPTTNACARGMDAMFPVNKPAG